MKKEGQLLMCVAITSFAIGHAVGSSRRPVVNVPFQVDMYQPITKIDGRPVLPEVRWDGKYTFPKKK